jgi:hypothetical protein
MQTRGVDFCAQFPEEYYAGCNALTVKKQTPCKSPNDGKMYCLVHRYLEPGNHQLDEEFPLNIKSVRMRQVLMLIDKLTMEERREVCERNISK